MSNLQALKPFLWVDETTSLHLARPELVRPVFEAVDANRHFLRQWMPWVDGTRSEEDTKTFIQDSMKQNSEGGRLTLFIVHQARLAGTVGAVHFNKANKKCEIGYWLGQPFQGQGIMTKACKVLISYLFRTKDLNRMEIMAMPANTGSRAVAQRLGFRHEGTLRQAMYLAGAFHDLELYALLKAEWQVWNSGDMEKNNQKI